MPVIGQPAHTHFTPIVTPVALDRISLSVTYLYNISAASYRVSLARTYLYDLKVIVSRQGVYLYDLNPPAPLGPTRLYFHAVTNTLPNLPTTERSTLTLNKAVDPETLNRTLGTVIGVAQTSLVLSTTATSTLQRYYFSRFVSDTLSGISSITAQNWIYNFAIKESGVSANFPVSGTNQPVRVTAYVWRPATQSKVGDIVDGNSASTVDEASTGFERVQITTFSGNQVLNVQNGDVLCFEVWFEIAQTQAIAFTDTFYYDGTTVNTTKNTNVTNHASFIETPQGLVFGLAPTRISKVCIQKYNIIGRVTGFSKVYKYSIAALASVSRTYNYAITTAVSLPVSYLYDLTGRLSVSSRAKYDILVRKQAPKIFRYSLQSTLQSSKVYKYNIATGLTSSQVYKYNIANSVAISQTYIYDLFSAVHLSRIYTYSLISRLSLSRAYRYNIAESVSSDTIYRYALTVRTASSQAYKYNIANLRSASSHYRYSLLSKLSTSRIFTYNINLAIQSVNLNRIYRYNLVVRILSSHIHRYNLLTLRQKPQTYLYSLLKRISKINTYVYRIGGGVSLSQTYRYNSIARVSQQSRYLYSIATFAPTVQWQITGKDTDFPDSLENLVRDFIKANWSITEPVVGQSPIITTAISRQHQTQMDNFAYDSYRTYYIRVKEVQSAVKNRQVRLNTYEFETPVELELFSRRLTKGESFSELNAMLNELLRIFGTYQTDQIFGIEGITLDRISSMEKERPPAQTTWARKLRIILHYYKVSVVG